MSFSEPGVSFSSNFSPLFSVMGQLFCTFSFKSLYALDKRSQSKCKFSGFRLIAWRLSFPLNFASLFTVIIHSSEIASLKDYLLWTNRAHQCTIFQTFGYSNERSLNSSCHFWNHKLKVCSNFVSLFSTMKDNTSVFFSLNLIYFGQKEPTKVNFPEAWVVTWKSTKLIMS